jgi:mRNA interferase MazF
MPSFRRGDVVKVPFPYTDQPTRQFRPALVVSAGSIEDAHGLLWVLMITSAGNRGWPGDVPIGNLSAAGLPVASVIRTAKIATIEAADATKLGRIPAAQTRQVARLLARELGVTPVVAKAVQ